MRFYRVVAVVLGLLVFGLSGARAEEPVKIRIGWAVIPGQLTAILYSKKDVLKHYGKSYTVEPVYFRGSAPQITALAAGELDIAAFAFSTFGLAIQNAHMQDLRAIGDLYQDGADDHYSSEYVVLKDSPIHKIEDLKGKILATNGIGGAVDMAMRKILRDHGLEDRRDYQIVEVQFPNMIPTLTEKKVDLAILVTPFSYIAKKEGKVRTLFTVKDAMGPTQLTLMAARAPWIAAHRAALVDFFEDTQRALHWMLDPKNRNEVIGILSKFTKEPPSAYADWLFTNNDYYHDPNARPNLEALQNNLNLQKELGFLKIDIDVKKYADLSLVDEAAKRTK